MASIWGELKRRNVVRVAIAYVIIAWLTLQVGDTLAPALHLGEWVNTALAFFLILGFPMALFFAWAFEITPEGITLEKHVVRDESITHHTGRKLDFVIIAMLVVALGYFGYDKFILNPDRSVAEIDAAVQVAREEVANAVERQESAKSIAVLAFADLSPEGDQEYFSDGISEEILNLLAKVPEMRVTSRTSAFSFKGQNVDIPTIAGKLNVAHVLEGSVRKSGDQLRITAQLIEVATDTHLWSATYERQLESVFAIQDEIAAAVLDALRVTLLGDEPKAVETDAEAYILYLQARKLTYDGFSEETAQKAEALLLKTLDIDPRFAPSWTLLGGVYRSQASQFVLRPIDEGNELARHAIQQALAIDPKYGEAYAVLAEIESVYDRDFVTAFRHLQQALAFDPNSIHVLTTAAKLNGRLGHMDEAIDLARQIIASDPLSVKGYSQLGANYRRAHRPDEAVDAYRMALKLGPDSLGFHYLLGAALLDQGDTKAALALMEKVPFEGNRVLGTAVVRHAMGDAGASDAALQDLIENWGAGSDYQIALAYAFRGEIDHAFDWLEQAYENRDGGLANVKMDAWLINLHDDPRWEPFLDKMGFPR